MRVEDDVVEGFHDVAKYRPQRAARRACLLGEFFLEIGFPLGPHDDGLCFLVVIYTGNHIIRAQHVLVQQVSDSETFGIVADGHQGDDLAAVQKQGERPLDGDGSIDRLAVLVCARDPFGQARIVRVR